MEYNRITVIDPTRARVAPTYCADGLVLPFHQGTYSSAYTTSSYPRAMTASECESP